MSAGIIPTFVYRAVFWRPKAEDYVVNEEFVLKGNTIT